MFTAVQISAARWYFEGVWAFHVHTKPIALILDFAQRHDLCFRIVLNNKMIASVESAPFPHALRNDDLASARQSSGHLVSITYHDSGRQRDAGARLQSPGLGNGLRDFGPQNLPIALPQSRHSHFEVGEV
jgi:hypothetical protein